MGDWQLFQKSTALKVWNLALPHCKHQKVQLLLSVLNSYKRRQKEGKEMQDSQMLKIITSKICPVTFQVCLCLSLKTFSTGSSAYFKEFVCVVCHVRIRFLQIHNVPKFYTFVKSHCKHTCKENIYPVFYRRNIVLKMSTSKTANDRNLNNQCYPAWPTTYDLSAQMSHCLLGIWSHL